MKQTVTTFAKAGTRSLPATREALRRALQSRDALRRNAQLVRQEQAAQNREIQEKMKLLREKADAMQKAHEAEQALASFKAVEKYKATQEKAKQGFGTYIFGLAGAFTGAVIYDMVKDATKDAIKDAYNDCDKEKIVEVAKKEVTELYEKVCEVVARDAEGSQSEKDELIKEATTKKENLMAEVLTDATAVTKEVPSLIDGMSKDLIKTSQTVNKAGEVLKKTDIGGSEASVKLKVVDK